MLGEQDSFRDSINSLTSLVGNFSQHVDLARMDAVLAEVRCATCAATLAQRWVLACRVRSYF